MIPQVPVTATMLPEWIRRAATALNALITRYTALDERRDYEVRSVVFSPQFLPSSPETGMTIMDEADSVVKTWDGTTWRAHY